MPVFRFHHPVQVRFQDIDVGGHAHHSKALCYFEEARAAYWRDVAGRGTPREVNYILAEASVRYHARVLYPGLLTVATRVSVLGGKHFVMEYEARSEEGELLVSGSTVQVMYDYAKRASRRMSSGLAERIRAFEGPLPARRGP